MFLGWPLSPSDTSRVVHDLEGNQRKETAENNESLLLSLWRKLPTPLQEQSVNGFVSIDLFLAASSHSQQGPESCVLTLLHPFCPFSLWHNPFVARETEKWSQKCIQGSTLTFPKAKALQPLTVLSFGLHLSNGIHLASLHWAIPPGTRGQVCEEDFGPMHPRIFWTSFIPSPWLEMSTNWQNGIISAWHRLWQPENTGKARSTFTLPHVHRHAKFQDGNLFPLQFYDTSTAWLSHFMAICIVMGLRQMKQIAIKCWECPKSWLCLACWMMPQGLNSDGLVQFAANSHTGLNV